MNKLPILLGCCLLIFSCKKENSQNNEKIETYPVTTPVQVSPNVNVDYVTQINGIQNVEIRSRIKGYLDKVLVDEGKYVKKDQVMFTIYNPELKEHLAKATAVFKSISTELKDAELQFANVKRLVEKNVVSTTELELAKNKVEMIKAKLEEAKAEQAAAQIQTTYTQIRAPFGGIVSRIPNKIGTLVEDGTLLTTVSNNEQVFAYFDVSEKEYLNYMKSLSDASLHADEATLILANDDIHTEKGIVETTEGQIDPNTGNIAFRARFKNPKLIIKNGASGKVRLLKRFQNATIIPQKSTFEIQDRTYVFVLNAKNEIKTRAVSINARIPHFFIINNGLSLTDRIIFEGVQNLKDGMIVKPELVNLMDEYNKLNKIQP
ncbi:efflux RND transporter periplasmic adaptor subunit [Lacihabitans soyangensis]|uniref:Efflux RND transporter periplasmic adaptor subunit n=1 Tax=Lacihabitans soyangensis TaxID=869394 RepID=A0AAE3H607_9BACT|nr:efflux RND transporter periplasmic adaptor subunit [Lacihabitans soyangensis]MCP9763650.1 efflux RND transporter periplasmic adaptor subunit [Lacihabitans soyangensis]